MDYFNIFKRRKPQVREFPEDISNNWKQREYEKNVIEGARALEKGKSIKIFDDGRGYELALEIKREVILEYQRYLAERIKIKYCGSEILIKWGDFPTP